MMVEYARGVLGKEGEKIAEQYLKRKGYTLIARNYRCPVGELDLIALDRRVIVFIEVKTRTGDGFGTPLEAVAPRKQRKIVQSAKFFLQEKGLQQRDARFDVIGVSWKGPGPRVEHIENAFEATY